MVAVMQQVRINVRIGHYVQRIYSGGSEVPRVCSGETKSWKLAEGGREDSGKCTAIQYCRIVGQRFRCDIRDDPVRKAKEEYPLNL